MISISIEEQINCFADKFFSKDKKFLTKEIPVDQIRKSQLKFGKDKVKIFNKWLEKFGI